MHHLISLRDVDNDLFDALVAGDHHVAIRFGLAVERDYLALPSGSAAARFRRLRARLASPWGTVLFLADHRLVVGIGGYHGPPDRDGRVAISFSIAPGCRGRGYATAAVALLIDRARASRVVKAIDALSPWESQAAERVLARNGFTRVATRHHEHDVGASLHWELPLIA